MKKIKEIFSIFLVALLLIITFVVFQQLGSKFANVSTSTTTTSFVGEETQMQTTIPQTITTDPTQVMTEPTNTNKEEVITTISSEKFETTPIESNTEKITVSTQVPTQTQIKPSETVEQTIIQTTNTSETTTTITTTSKKQNVENIEIPTGTYYDIDKNGKIKTEVAIKIDNVIFVGEKGVDNKTLVAAYNDIKSLSSGLKECIKMIIITPDDLAEKFNFSESDVGKISGISNGFTIYITDYKYEPYVLIHESMHCADYFYEIPEQNIRYRSNTAGWKDLFEANTYTYKDCWYVRNSCVEEYFASVAQIWYMDPEYTKKMFPKEYKYFNNLFGEKMSDRIDYTLDRL